MVFLLMIKDQKTERKKNSDHLWEENQISNHELLSPRSYRYFILLI